MCSDILEFFFQLTSRFLPGQFLLSANGSLLFDRNDALIWKLTL